MNEKDQLSAWKKKYRDEISTHHNATHAQAVVLDHSKMLHEIPLFALAVESFDQD